MVALASGGVVVVLGGQDSAALRNDVWVSASRGKSWTAIDGAGVQIWSPRSGHVAVVLPHDVVLIMGGWDGAYRNDVWRGTAGAALWLEVHPAGQRWPGRWGHAGVVLGDGPRVMVAGGFANDTHLGDVWISDSEGATWTEAAGADRWSPRCEHRMVPHGNRSAVLIGGWASGRHLDDVWRLDDDTGARWTRLAPPTAPTDHHPSSGWHAVHGFPEDTADYSSIGGLPPDDRKWFGGVLAPNGKIYAIPRHASSVLIVDPATDTVDITSISGLSDEKSKWTGGVVGVNGKIYGIPEKARSVLIIDPETNAVDAEAISLAGITGEWTGGVLAPNGLIFGIPLNGETVLAIDPAINTTQLVAINDLPPNPGSNLWGGGVLAPNGKIYGMPCNAAALLVIDPESRTAQYCAGNGITTAQRKWFGGVLAPNGLIYGIPLNAASVLVVNPGANATDVLPVSGMAPQAAATHWIGGVLARSGKIYGIPANEHALLVIDSVTNATRVQPIAGMAGVAQWWGGVLAPNGKIYGIPGNTTSVLQIRAGVPLFPAWMEGPYFNKF